MQHNFEDADMINRRWRTLRRPRGGEHRDEACPVHKAAARDAGDLTVPADCISRCFRHGPQALKAYPDRNKVLRGNVRGALVFSVMGAGWFCEKPG